MARSETGARRGRKLKPSTDAVSQEQQEMLNKAEQSSQKSGKRSSSSRRSKKSKKEEVANMADDGPASIDAQVDAGNFKSEFITGDDKEDIKKIEDDNFKQTALNARGRLHTYCDDCELFADAMMADALLNKQGRQRVLDQRMKVLKALWNFRDTADCEDDFSNEEFHGAMRVLATIQRKLRSLDTKIGNMMNGAEQSSSDTDGEGEKEALQKLKNARQNLRYAMNPGTMPA